MTLIAELDHEVDPAVVVTLYDYGEDHVPGHMKPPVFIDVTDEDPRPEPGFTYDGETFTAGVPQAHEATRMDGRDQLDKALARNETYLGLNPPTAQQMQAQVRSLTQQASLLIRGALQKFD